MAYSHRSAVTSMNADYNYSNYRRTAQSGGMRPRSYSTVPTRTPYTSNLSRADSIVYDTRVQDYLLSSRVDDASYLSSAMLDDTYDTAKRSRGRDAKLLRDATNAIVSSESYATPQTSVVSRRVARGRSVVPSRAASVPPRPVSNAYLQAAIIASKMEPDPLKRRRPKSEFAAAKYRAMRKDHQESIYSGLPSSSGLSASNPPLPKLTERKAIRTEDGYTKPKNLMSWQYRLDSMMSPNDLLYQPSSFIRLREQVRDAQERMDRHRQLLDRYLPEGDNTDVAATVLRKMHEMEKRDAVSFRSGGGDEVRRSTVKIPDYYATGVDPRNPPVSDLRRRIRRTLNKTRNS